MAKRRTATADLPLAELPPSDTNGNNLPEEATGTALADATMTSPSDSSHAGNGNGEPKKKPVISWRYPTDRTTTIEVSVWPNFITLQTGEQIQVYSVTFQRSYKDQANNWCKNGSYRGHDLPVLLHALQKAHAWILDQRDLNSTL